MHNLPAAAPGKPANEHYAELPGCDRISSRHVGAMGRTASQHPPSRHFASSSSTLSTSDTSAYRRRWLSRTSSGLPPRSGARGESGPREKEGGEGERHGAGSGWRRQAAAGGGRAIAPCRALIGGLASSTLLLGSGSRRGCPAPSLAPAVLHGGQLGGRRRPGSLCVLPLKRTFPE